LYARIVPVVGVQILPNNRLYFNASIGPGLLIFQDYSLWIAALAQMKAGIILNKPPG